jgi:choline dehydrogenase-like flavoprotein
MTSTTSSSVRAPAGCVVAARLAEDPATTVLLVEAGKPARGLSVTMPAALPLAYQRTDIQWGYESGPEPHLDGRTIDEKAGKVVGGSSSINAMIFNRGNPLDYEAWAAAGPPDWDYAHCLPYFKRDGSESSHAGRRPRSAHTHEPGGGSQDDDGPQWRRGGAMAVQITQPPWPPSRGW